RHIESTAHASIFSFHYTVDNGGRREYSDQIRPDRGVPAAVAGPWLGRRGRWHDHGDLGDEDPPALPRPRGRSAQALRPHLLPLRSPHPAVIHPFGHLADVEDLRPAAGSCDIDDEFRRPPRKGRPRRSAQPPRSEEHTSELQS